MHRPESAFRTRRFRDLPCNRRGYAAGRPRRPRGPPIRSVSCDCIVPAVLAIRSVALMFPISASPASNEVSWEGSQRPMPSVQSLTLRWCRAVRTSLASACVNLEESQDATPSLQSERFADALGSGYPARFGRSEPRIHRSDVRPPTLPGWVRRLQRTMAGLPRTSRSSKVRRQFESPPSC